MKKLLPYITIFTIIFIIIVLFLSMSTSQNMTVVYTGNIKKQPIPIILGKYQDSDCGMVIDDITYASQVVAPDGKTWFFHDHGGMVNWLHTKKFKDDAIIWTHTKDTNEWLDGRRLWYTRTDTTPMGYGFGAYKYKKNNMINFDAMFLHMIRGEHLGNPFVKKQLLGDNNGSY